jgi:peptidoglycan/xylan/chitin deacetylase (PgdA/CDA1 family)
MKTTNLITSMIQRQARFNHRVLKAYADWRVGATDDEKRAYKTSDSILLTFDDYGTESQVTELLSVLRRDKVRAMFFLQGDWADANPDLVKAIAKSGHVIGNHTYSHKNMIALSNEEIRSEIVRGVKSTWLRPPQGKYNSRIRNIARGLGFRICYWSTDSDDWQGVSGDYISRKVLSEIGPGSVILFHMHADNTIKVLPSLIEAIRSRGYELTSPKEPLWGPGK